MITEWGYDYLLRVRLVSSPKHHFLESIIGPFNVARRRQWSGGSSGGGPAGAGQDTDALAPVTLLIEGVRYDDLDQDDMAHTKFEVFLINFLGRVYNKVTWRRLFTEAAKDRTIKVNALIAGTPGRVNETQLELQTDAQKELLVKFGNLTLRMSYAEIDEERRVHTLAQLQEERRERVVPQDGGLLPMPWLLALGINGFLVVLFFFFILYCYCKGKTLKSITCHVASHFELSLQPSQRPMN